MLPCFTETAGGLVSSCEPPEGVFTSIAGCCPRCSRLVWTFTISRDFNNRRFLSLHLWEKHDAAGNLQWIIRMITEQLRVLLRNSFFSSVSSSSLVSDDFHVRLNIEAPSSIITSRLPGRQQHNDASISSPDRPEQRDHPAPTLWFLRADSVFCIRLHRRGRASTSRSTCIVVIKLKKIACSLIITLHDRTRFGPLKWNK